MEFVGHFMLLYAVEYLFHLYILKKIFIYILYIYIYNVKFSNNEEFHEFFNIIQRFFSSNKN